MLWEKVVKIVKKDVSRRRIGTPLGSHILRGPFFVEIIGKIDGMFLFFNNLE
jgi:hypothetical protein